MSFSSSVKNIAVPNSMTAVVIKGTEVVVEKDVPLPPIRDGSFLVRVEAAAGNPTDWKHATYKIGPQGAICGCDVAGEIVKLGPNVKGFEVGDHVFGLVHGASVKYPNNGGFAEYSALDSKLALKVPKGAKLSGKEHIPAGTVNTIEAAASLPVSMYTAGLVLTHHLGLKNKWEPTAPQHDFPLLIWGGATAVGHFLIQLAKKMHGYTKIIVVASRKHEKLLKHYGADELYDYHDSDVIEQIKKKYDHLPQLIDAVSAPESFTEVYKLGSKHAPTTLLQLTVMSEKIIKPEERNPNVKVDGALLYLVGGEEVPFGDVTFPASPGDRQAMIDFLHFIGPKINSGELHHMAIETFRGLNKVPALLEGIKEGKNANVKYVATL